MKNNKMKIIYFLLAIASFILLLSTNNFAQDGREEHHDNGRHEGWYKHHEDEHHEEGKRNTWYKHEDEHRWGKREDDYREVRFRDHHYYFHRGEFYERRSEGYVEVNAPLGIRVTYIPRDYKVVRFSGVRFYLFGGIYYRYNPHGRFYFVVNAPF